jgi:hypothetical protein
MHLVHRGSCLDAKEKTRRDGRVKTHSSILAVPQEITVRSCNKKLQSANLPPAPLHVGDQNAKLARENRGLADGKYDCGVHGSRSGACVQGL